ncbi:hypothetical protein [Streptomyces sp. NBC_01235]|uniref:hypothetical protein n=1 Tax=Streptomyces sp. NBC_01235 TaxID=2903788 RepID=UPI002E1600A2|nr:hypothetical protein OG289_46760 [Streptomyces sp. NBC_01235]
MSTNDRSGPVRGFLEPSTSVSNLSKDFTTADPAFVVTTAAVFALVALGAKGVTKL